MTDAVETNLGLKPEQLSAYACYCSEANLPCLSPPASSLGLRLCLAATDRALKKIFQT